MSLQKYNINDPSFFMIIDVFSDQLFGGNKLVVFPNAQSFSTKTMQAIAREFGSGETVFADCSKDNLFKLRLFTPLAEIPVTDLSLLGATCCLTEIAAMEQPDTAGQFVWHSEAGEHVVDYKESDSSRVYNTSHSEIDFIGQYYKRSNVAEALGLEEKDIAITGLPCEIVSTGIPIHIVPLGNLDAIGKIRINHRACRKIIDDLGFGDLFVFVCDSENDGVDIHCRFFAQGFGIPEDPASGSACSALMAYLIKHRLVSTASSVHIVCEQGIEMGRPSTLYLSADIKNGDVVSINVGGECTVSGSGNMQLSKLEL